MKKFKFQINSEDDLILIEAFVNGYRIKLALDTAASHTVVDTTALMIAGMDLESNNKVKIETASGIIEANKIKTNIFNALGLTKPNFEISAYDFLSAGLLVEIDGVLGLDFLKNNILTIDFIKSELWLKK